MSTFTSVKKTYKTRRENDGKTFMEPVVTMRD